MAVVKNHRNYLTIFAFVIGFAVLLATILHGIEATIWALAYRLLGALPDTKSAMLYSLNAITAKKDPDGAVTVQFGACDGRTPNCLPVMPGWTYTVRLYRPRAEILDGTWRFPEAQVVP